VSRRDDVVLALRQAGGFLSAQTIYARIRDDGTRIGLATVYRILQTLATEGDVDVVRTGDGEALYRACRSAGHHHHLICRSCGQAVELDAEVVEQWARAVAQEHGFSAVDHVVEIVGTCAACTQDAGAPQALA
jgi:Fur family transcriptional regulator, ferric uptake regulator